MATLAAHDPGHGAHPWSWMKTSLLAAASAVSQLLVKSLGARLSVSPRWVNNHARTNSIVFFPRVRTPCGHGAQVIVEGREEQSDGGERNRETQHHTKQTKQHNPGPTGRASTIM